MVHDITNSGIHSGYLSEYSKKINDRRKNAYISELKGRYKLESFDELSFERLFMLKTHESQSFQLSLNDQGVQFESDGKFSYYDYILAHQKIFTLRPWKKGPYSINQIMIDAEWDTRLKFQRFQRCLPDIRNRRILDIGCNNGYFLFASQALGAEMSIGIDPSFRPYFQFLLLKSLVPDIKNIQYYWLGIDELHYLASPIDTILCMGILYHRPSSVACLEQLYHYMKPGSILILETIVVNTDEKYCLHPNGYYQKMRNILEIPSPSLLMEWANSAGFSIEYIDPIEKTHPIEQRATYLGVSKSLDAFLDPNNPEKTIEGHPAAYRIMMRLKK